MARDGQGEGTRRPTVFVPDPGNRRGKPAPPGDGSLRAAGAFGKARRFEQGDAAEPAPRETADGSDAAAQACGLDLSPVEIAPAPGPNPLLQAATPILIVLGRIRTRMLAAESVERVLAEMASAVATFERSAAGAAGPAQVRTAKYILCATVDDVMQNIPVDDPRIWIGKGMLITFFDSRDGGVRFFDELTRAVADPAGNRDLLHLFHACLAVGFLGRCRKEGGAPAAAVVQRDVYETLQRLNPARYEDLSPRWKGADVPLRQDRVRIPYWAAACFAALFLVTLYVMVLGMLTARTGDAQAAMAAAVPMGAVDLRHLPVPGATAANTQAAAAGRLPVGTQVEHTTQLERIRAGLAEQIGSGQVTVDATPKFIVIRVGAVVTFEPGSADLAAEFPPLAGQIAAVLDKEPGVIRVVGHSDSTPIHTARFPSNFELSVARARSVAAALSEVLTDHDRVEVEGRGDTVPIATNATPEGRAVNRRVDIQLPREQE